MRMTARSSSCVGGEPGGWRGLSRSSCRVASGVTSSAQYAHFDGFWSPSNKPTAMISGAVSDDQSMLLGSPVGVFVQTGRRNQGLGAPLGSFGFGSMKLCAGRHLENCFFN